MPKQVISTDAAPGAVGPYSQAIVANGFVFASGQLALDTNTMKLIDGDVQAQARKALENMQAVLAAAGTNVANAVKVTVFLADINDFAAVNAVYAQVFDAAGAPPPARSAVQVANLPLGALVEIEVIATVE
jgi:2-iminobutanoate/2-iminopropanoate deaminase